MLFCQLAQARSSREISDGLKCCEGKLKHLGLEAEPKRSNLSYAKTEQQGHVTALGNERKPIFRRDADRFRFLELLAELGERFGLRVHAYVLMDNTAVQISRF